MRELLEDYTLYVIYKDWPAHCQGIIYHGGTNRLSIIEYSILNCNPEDESQQIIQVRHFRNLGSSSRRDSGVCPAPGCRSRESCGMS
jgi:hypothetical protein